MADLGPDLRNKTRGLEAISALEPLRVGSGTNRRTQRLHGGRSMGSPRSIDPYSAHTAKMHLRLKPSIASQLAKETKLPVEMRMLFMACSRSRNSHAAFRPGELVDLLPKDDKGARFTERHLRNVIGDLVCSGVLGKPSTLRCLVLPGEFADATLQSLNGFTCPEHRTSQRWIHGHWENANLVPDSGNWQRAARG